MGEIREYIKKKGIINFLIESEIHGLKAMMVGFLVMLVGILTPLNWVGHHTKKVTKWAKRTIKDNQITA